MKKKLSLVITLALILSLSAAVISGAAEKTETRNLPVGASSSMTMVGTIEPTILSVTMPTYVPFTISNNIAAPNKVLSPRINVINNSKIPVQIDVDHTWVDLSGLNNTTWSDTGVVTDNQISIGFKKETTPNLAPVDLTDAKWLSANSSQSVNVLTLNPLSDGNMYVVGTMGILVSENSSFRVTPTFVVHPYSGSK